MNREKQNIETWKRLREWQRGQPAAERLCGQILAASGFQEIDPSHPLGGPDGLKDFKCKKDGQLWVAAVYFPRGEHTFTEIKKKFSDDSNGVAANKAEGFAFLTNQEITLADRDELKQLVPFPIDLFHLEKISHILDTPAFFGTRLEFLDIEMTKEEQLSFFAQVTNQISTLVKVVDALKEGKEKSANFPKGIPSVSPQTVLSSLLGRAWSPRLHACSKCKELYKIQPNIFASGYLQPGEQQYVECPKCHFKEIYIPLV